MAVLAALAAYGIAVNLLAFALFGIDKRRAVAGAWRIRESTLIGTALAGGWLGAKAGQRRFRHKTTKQPFGRRLDAVGRLHLGLVAATAAAAISPAVDVAGMAQAIGRAQPVLVAEGLGTEASSPGPMPRRFGPGSGVDGW